MDTVKRIGSLGLAIVASVAAVLLSCPVGAEDDVDVRSDGARLTARIEDRSLRDVTEAITRTTGIRFHWMVDQGDELVDATFDRLPLGDAIALLLEARNYSVLPGAAGGVSVWVGSIVSDATSQGPREQAPPASQPPPSAAGSPREIPMQTVRAGGATGGSSMTPPERGGAASLSGADSSSAFDQGPGQQGFDASLPDAGDEFASASGAQLDGGAASDGDSASDGDTDASDPDTEPSPREEEATFAATPVEGRMLVLEDLAVRAGWRTLRARLRAPREAALVEIASDADPSLHGAVLALWNLASGEQSVLELPSAGWTREERSQGWLYSDPRRERGPCETVSLRASGAIAIGCRGEELELSLDEPSQGAIAVQLTLGEAAAAAAARLCAVFGGQIHADRPVDAAKSGRFHATDAPAPHECPVLPAPEVQGEQASSVVARDP